MYVNTGYLNHAETDLENPQIPLRINSSGIYRVDVYKRQAEYTENIFPLMIMPISLI